MKKFFLTVVILTACIVLDQVTKFAAQFYLFQTQPVSYLGGVFVFEYSENKGAILGLGADLPAEVRLWILVVFNSLLLIGLFWFILRSKEITNLGVMGSALIIGGGVSNLIDRVLNDGAVIDFMHIGLGQLRTGIFNVADTAIMAGIGILLLWNVQQSRKK